jgi:hypothetical protein
VVEGQSSLGWEVVGLCPSLPARVRHRVEPIPIRLLPHVLNVEKLLPHSEIIKTLHATSGRLHASIFPVEGSAPTISPVCADPNTMPMIRVERCDMVPSFQLVKFTVLSVRPTLADSQGPLTGKPHDRIWGQA